MKPKPKDDPEAVAETASEESRKHVPERQLRNHGQLAKIEAVQVAQIAATLRRNGEDEIEAVRVAYTLLDIAEHCKLSLKNEASVEAGIRRYQEGVKVDEEFYAAYPPHFEQKVALDNLPHYDPDKVEPAAKRENIEFRTGLEAAISLPQSTPNKSDRRLTLLRRFLKWKLAKDHPKMSETDLTLAAGEEIERMQRDGMEPNFLEFLKLRFLGWWEETYKADQSEKGKRGGQAVKKGKQARVKSNSNKS